MLEVMLHRNRAELSTRSVGLLLVVVLGVVLHEQILSIIEYYQWLFADPSRIATEAALFTFSLFFAEADPRGGPLAALPFVVVIVPLVLAFDFGSCTRCGTTSYFGGVSACKTCDYALCSSCRMDAGAGVVNRGTCPNCGNKL